VMIDNFEGEAGTPPKEKAKKGDSGRLVVWLVALSMAMLFLPLWLMSATLQEDVAQLETEQAQLAEALNLTPTPDAAAEDLRTELLALRNDVVTLEGKIEELAGQSLDWYVVMDLLLQYDQSAMQLTHIAQQERGLIVEGLAENEDSILSYVNTLRQAATFDGVQVQSILREDGAEDAQPDRYAFQLLVELGGDNDG